MTARCYFLVTVDTEGDRQPDWSVRWPLSFTAVWRTIPERLDPVFRRNGVRATYLLSPEVIRDDRSVEILLDQNRSGAELGAHLHGEFVEPESTPEPQSASTMQNTYPPDLEYAKLEALTELYCRRFGRPPRSFRAGRFGLSEHTMGYLEKLGYRVDSSVAPLTSWSDSGGNVEFYGVPDQPYFPSSEDYRREGSCNVLEVPVTIFNRCYARLPRSWVRCVPRLQPWWDRFLKYGGLSARFKPLWLRPTFKAGTVGNLCRLVDTMMDGAGNNDPLFLVMMFHNVDFEPGCSPYAQNDTQAEEFIRRLDGVLSHARRRGCAFMTLEETVEHFRPAVRRPNGAAGTSSGEGKEA